MRGLQHVRSLALKAQIVLQREGFGWIAAVLLVLCAIAIELTLTLPAQRERRIAEAALEAMHVKDATNSTAPNPASIDAVSAPLRPPARASAAARLYELAKNQSIAVAQSDYRQQWHPETRVLQLEVIQPVRATYPQLRSYVEDVLLQMPNASLDHISARRESVGQPQLDARLRWSIWERSPGQGAAQ